MNWFLSNPANPASDQALLKVSRELMYQLYRGALAGGGTEDLSPHFDSEILVAIDSWHGMRPSRAKRKLLKAGIWYLLHEIFRQELGGYFKRQTLLRAMELVRYKD